MNDDYLSYSTWSRDNEWFKCLDILLLIEEAEILLCIAVDIFRLSCGIISYLLKKQLTGEVIEDLFKFWMFLKVLNMLLLDIMFNVKEVGLKFRIKLLLLVHSINMRFDVFIYIRHNNVLSLLSGLLLGFWCFLYNFLFLLNFNGLH